MLKGLYKDEDLDLFLEELGILLGKYHYGFKNSFTIMRLPNSNIGIYGFRAIADSEFEVMYLDRTK